MLLASAMWSLLCINDVVRPWIFVHLARQRHPSVRVKFLAGFNRNGMRFFDMQKGEWTTIDRKHANQLLVAGEDQGASYAFGANTLAANRPFYEHLQQLKKCFQKAGNFPARNVAAPLEWHVVHRVVGLDLFEDENGFPYIPFIEQFRDFQDWVLGRWKRSFGFRVHGSEALASPHADHGASRAVHVQHVKLLFQSLVKLVWSIQAGSHWAWSGIGKQFVRRCT
jgi:hypothetical protein